MPFRIGNVSIVPSHLNRLLNALVTDFVWTKVVLHLLHVSVSTAFIYIAYILHTGARGNGDNGIGVVRFFVVYSVYVVLVDHIWFDLDYWVNILLPMLKSFYVHVALEMFCGKYFMKCYKCEPHQLHDIVPIDSAQT